jgi:hypothetical protein
MGEPVFIPWSGGYDSTALICKTIREGREVHAHHVACWRDGAYKPRAPMEAFAVEALAPRIQATVGPFTFTKATTTHTGIGYQPILIFPSLLMVVEDYLMGRNAGFNRDKWVEIAIPFQAEEQACWAHLMADRMLDLIATWFYTLPVKTPYMSVPFAAWRKERVIAELPQELHQYIRTCQSPTNDWQRCGTCLSCTREEEAMSRYVSLPKENPT